MVKAATGTLPQASAHSVRAQPGDESVGILGRFGVVPQLGRTEDLARARSRTTRPCCWAATAIATTSAGLAPGPPTAEGRRPSPSTSAAHQSSGCLFAPGRRGDRVSGPHRRRPPARWPDRGSSTLVDWVDESTPATSGMLATLPPSSVRGRNQPALARATAPIPRRAGLGAAGERLRVDTVQSELGPESEGPLEVVEQAPHEVPTDVHAVIEGAPHSAQDLGDDR